jgi:hypothetical protein
MISLLCGARMKLPLHHQDGRDVVFRRGFFLP